MFQKSDRSKVLPRVWSDEPVDSNWGKKWQLHLLDLRQLLNSIWGYYMLPVSEFCCTSQ